jgi:Flp pilus assembly CpaE family ATPase
MRVLIVESGSAEQASTARRLEAMDRVDKDTLDLSVGLSDEHGALERLNTCDVLLLGASLGERSLALARQAKASAEQVQILMIVSDSMYSAGAFRAALGTGTRKVFAESAPLLDMVQELMSVREEFRASGRVRPSRVIAVVQAKGGVGATSACAALAEVCGAQQQRTMMWDLDIETRDLCRAFVIDGPHADVVGNMVQGEEEISRDSLRRAEVGVSSHISILPPPSQISSCIDLVGRVECLEAVQALLGTARATHDNVIVDVGGRLGPAAAAIIRDADAVLVMLDDSLLGLSAARFFIPTLRSLVRNQESILFLCSGISVSRSELAKHMQQDDETTSNAWSLPAIPFDSAAARWPGSGKTLYGMGCKQTRRAFEQIAATLDLIDSEPDAREMSPQTRPEVELSSVLLAVANSINPLRALWHKA